MSDIVNKLWGFCHVLRNDGVDYGDYIEQLTYLLFLKMGEEKEVAIPRGYDWASLKNKSGNDLTNHYERLLSHLREQSGLLGDIFTQSVPRFNNPVNLKKLISMIDAEEWSAMDVDVKGEAFEGLLERAASEGKKGAGQYFTPRVLIKSIVRIMKPDPRGNTEFRISDPACGSGGFLVCAYEWLNEKAKGVFDRTEAKRIRTKTYFGQDLVPRPRRMALMNLYLHGVEPHIYLGDAIYETDRGERFDCVLTNPPFGTKGDRPLTEAHFAEFEKAFGANPNGTSKRSDSERFRRFHITDIKERDYKLDITWIKDESLEDADDLPEPDILASEAITELEAVVDDLREIISLIEKEEMVAAV